ncbi:MAG: relaxase/mobilization nuclease domain-containing protein, partial [Ruminococcus sp.]|nr:relaxase/mobilization nuclease domain-containing protein [Ruminococcus sp.]
NVNGENAFKEFMTTKNAYHKTDGINFYQYVQSYSPEEQITAEEAHKIALEFAQIAWQGHEVLVTTHTDAEHIHSHFVINSVSFENGYKLRQSPNTLKELRALSDNICKAYGLTTLNPYEDGGVKISAREYRVAVKGDSWKFKLMSAIDESMKTSGSRQEFINRMESYGYSVNWSDNRKYITFTSPTGMKCRDIKLHDEKYLKENLENELYFREWYYKKQINGRTTEREEQSRYTSTERTTYAGDGTDTREKLGYDGKSSSVMSGVSLRGVRATENLGDIYADAELYGKLVEETAGEILREESGTGQETSRSSCGSQRYSDENERLRTTGWEENRSDYERYLGQGRRVATSDSQSFNENREKSLVQTHGNIGDSITACGSALNSAMHMVANLIDESEDEEEQRKRIEAEQNASNLGALIGVAVGLLTPQDEIETDNFIDEQDDFEMKLDM